MEGKGGMMGDEQWADPGLPDHGGHCQFSGGERSMGSRQIVVSSKTLNLICDLTAV